MASDPKKSDPPQDFQTSPYTSERFRWYDIDTGLPVSGVPKASNPLESRSPTLGDAKKTRQTVPSVTSITGMLSKPGLEVYKDNQMSMAVETAGAREAHESPEHYWEKVSDIADQHRKEAADRGAIIHGEICRAGDGDTGPFEYSDYWRPALTWALAGAFKNEGEVPFANIEHGFGGTADLVAMKKTKSGVIRPAIYDWKCQGFEKNPKPWVHSHGNDHQIQLDAYALGLELDQEPGLELWNVYISTETPGLFVPVPRSPGQMTYAFLHLLSFWKITNAYEAQNNGGHHA